MPEFAARAFHNQSARRDVPKIDAALDVGVKSPRGHIGQTQRRRAHHADFSHATREPREVGQGVFHARATFGEADGDDGISECAA